MIVVIFQGTVLFTMHEGFVSILGSCLNDLNEAHLHLHFDLLHPHRHICSFLDEALEWSKLLTTKGRIKL
jgi:hypothetical protein